MTDGAQHLSIGPFRMDLGAECLWHGPDAIQLRPKTWEVLRHLVERAGQLVTKDELLAQVWAGTIVTEGTLTQSIRELRVALDDDPKRPRYIATVHRRGYRLIAPIEGDTHAAPAAEIETQASVALIGRDNELGQLHDALAAVIGGQRRSLFVTGAPGIGKTALLDAFVAAIGRRPVAEVLVARGQCVELRGEAEPYLPVLEALYHLCIGPDGAQVRDVLRRFAPTWLVQMPWLLAPADLEDLQRRLIGTGPARMLREFTTAMGELAAQRPLVLVLEDLHWSDLATVDLLAALARRRDRAPLLLIGSLRSAVTGSQRTPLEELVQNLTSRGDAREIGLDVLSPEAARAYVRSRLDGDAPAPLLEAIERHSGGSPLFLVTALGYALARGWVVQRAGAWHLAIGGDALEQAIPAGLRQLIEVQVAGLEPGERTLLEAASVAGMEFSAASLAVATANPVPEVQAALARLGQRRWFIRPSTLPTEAAPDQPQRFEFAHALYHQVLYEGTAPASRRQLHLAVARGLEVERSDRVAEVAAELALHFERGGSYDEAAKYLGLAALNAHARVADREAAHLLEKAIGLNAQCEDSPRQRRREADLCIQLGAVRGSIFGRGAPQYLAPFQRAWEVSQGLDDVPRMFLSRMASFGHFSLTEQFHPAEEVCRDLIALAARVPMPDMVAVADGAMGSVLCATGQLEEARRYLEKALATLNPYDPSTQLFRRIEDPEILCLTSLAWALAQLGFPDQARQRWGMASELGKARAPYHEIYTTNAAAVLALFFDDPDSCLQHAEETLELAREHGFDGFLANASVLAAWARERRQPRSGAWLRLRDEVDAYRRSPQRFGFAAYQGLVAEACLSEGAVEAGLATLATAMAIVEASGERAPESNLLRLQALLLAAAERPPREVEACFEAAITAARRSSGKLAELRAATSFAAWCEQAGEPKRAHALLAPTYGWFTEGFDIPDLQRAQRLLQRLASS